VALRHEASENAARTPHESVGHLGDEERSSPKAQRLIDATSTEPARQCAAIARAFSRGLTGGNFARTVAACRHAAIDARSSISGRHPISIENYRVRRSACRDRALFDAAHSASPRQSQSGNAHANRVADEVGEEESDTASSVLRIEEAS